MPGIDSVRNDDEGLIGRVSVEINQARARAVGLSSDEVAAALRALTSGEQVSVFREGDELIPVTIRDAAPGRRDPAYLGALSVFTEDGSTSALLGQIADTRFSPQASVIQRRDGVRQIVVTARGATLTATQIAAMAAPAIDALDLPPGHVVQLGGEIEDNAELGAALGGLLPLCIAGMFALFVWQFNSIRQAIIIMASIPFGVIGITLGLWAAGATLSFAAILGILALSGIIVNNAILLLERIHVEEAEGRPRTEAILEASVKRLRPIVMTKLVCILGLVPLMLFGGDLWYPMAAGMIGGLLLGTLITLGLVPVVYSLLYGRDASPGQFAAPQGVGR
jgi:multidrug efflux pump subunit AcrB